jgi:hypothetical protein
MGTDFINAKPIVGTTGLDALHWAKRKAQQLGSMIAEGSDEGGLDRPEMLDETTMNEMESVLGYSLNGARIHESRHAGCLAQKLGADAFTIGSDIYAAEGKLRGATRESKGLLAHELVHVVQQTSPLHLACVPENSSVVIAEGGGFNVTAEIPGGIQFEELPALQFALSNNRLNERGVQQADEESAAQATEQNIMQSETTFAGDKSAWTINPYEVADMVYLLMQRDLLIEKDRTGR